MRRLALAVLLAFVNSCAGPQEQLPPQANSDRLDHMIESRLEPLRAGCESGEVVLCEALGVSAQALWEDGIVTRVGTRDEIARLLAGAEFAAARQVAHHACLAGEKFGCRIAEGFQSIDWVNGFQPGYDSFFKRRLEPVEAERVRLRCAAGEIDACQAYLNHLAFVEPATDLHELSTTLYNSAAAACDERGEDCLRAMFHEPDDDRRCARSRAICTVDRPRACIQHAECLAVREDQEQAVRILKSVCGQKRRFLTGDACLHLAKLEANPINRGLLLRAGCQRQSRAACNELGDWLRAVGDDEAALVAFGVACSLADPRGCAEVECAIDAGATLSWYQTLTLDNPCGVSKEYWDAVGD